MSTEKIVVIKSPISDEYVTAYEVTTLAQDYYTNRNDTMYSPEVMSAITCKPNGWLYMNGEKFCKIKED